MDVAQILLARLDRFEEKMDTCVTGLEGVRGDITRVEQKVDLRHVALQDQVDDICERTDINRDNLRKHEDEDLGRFNEISTQRQVTKARLGMLALLGGIGGLGLDKLWTKVVALFSH